MICHESTPDGYIKCSSVFGVTLYEKIGGLERFGIKWLFEYQRINNLSVFSLLGLPFYRQIDNCSVLFGVDWSHSWLTTQS